MPRLNKPKLWLPTEPDTGLPLCPRCHGRLGPGMLHRMPGYPCCCPEGEVEPCARCNILGTTPDTWTVSGLTAVKGGDLPNPCAEGDCEDAFDGADFVLEQDSGCIWSLLVPACPGLDYTIYLNVFDGFGGVDFFSNPTGGGPAWIKNWATFGEAECDDSATWEHNGVGGFDSGCVFTLNDLTVTPN